MQKQNPITYWIDVWVSNKLWVFAMNKGTFDIQWNDTSIAPCVIHIMDDNVTWYEFIFAIYTLEIQVFFFIRCFVLFSFVFRFVSSIFELAFMKSEWFSCECRTKKKTKPIDINFRIRNASAIYVENKEIDIKSMCFALVHSFIFSFDRKIVQAAYWTVCDIFCKRITEGKMNLKKHTQIWKTMKTNRCRDVVAGALICIR